MSEPLKGATIAFRMGLFAIKRPTVVGCGGPCRKGALFGGECMALSNEAWRPGASHVNTVLLVLILAALVVLIVVVVVGPNGPRLGEGAFAPPQPVGDPSRVRDVLQEGKTYDSTLKTGLDAKVVDKDWGVRRTVSLVYVAEMRVRRTVERNDGKTVVLLCHILESRTTKLLTDAEVSFDLGEPGFLVLGVLDLWLTGGAGTAVAVEVGAVSEKLLTAASKTAWRGATAKAAAAADSLEGKRFRVTYRDGEGVVNLEPVECGLTDDERSYLEGLAVLSDCYLLPDLKSKPGQYWDVEARALADFLPPTWRGRPSGVVTIERQRDFRKGDKDYAELEITAGTFRVDASDGSRRRLGELTPRGRLDYNITDGYVDHAEFSVKASIEEVSTDHLLFEARFQGMPRLEIQYTCKRLEGAAEPGR